MATPPSIKEQTEAAVGILLAVADCIREITETSPLKGVPSGELYTMMMAALPSLTLEQYKVIIDKLKEAGVVQETAFILKWIGPKKGEYPDAKA